MRCTPKCATRSAACSADASVRVLLLTGAGRGFCAGQDLGDRAVAPGAEPVDLGASIERNYKPLVLALRALPLPVVCAVNGVAAGAGANIALACDIVIAAKSASFVQAFSKIGLLPDAGGTYLPAAAGRHRARDGSGDARRQALRRAGGELGADLEVRRRRRVAGDRRRAAAATGEPRRRAGSPRPSRRSTPPRATRSKRSSISSATCSASSGAAPTIAKACARSPPSARRSSPGNDGTLMPMGEHHPAASPRRTRRRWPSASPSDVRARPRVAGAGHAGRARRRRATPSSSMTRARRHAQRPRTCHGGFIFTLADSAFAFACNSYNLTTVASGCTIEFVAPAREGDVLTAVAQRAQRQRPHRRLRHRGHQPARRRRSRSSAASRTGSRAT